MGLIAIIVRRESPSKMREVLPKETASSAARRASWASPRLASMATSLLEQTAAKSPFWSLRVATATEKSGLMATSKFTFKVPRGGGDQSERGSPNLHGLK